MTLPDWNQRRDKKSMKSYHQDCSLCRVMRSLAFTGLGMGVGAAIAYIFGASRQNMILTGIVVAAILVFGLLGREKRYWKHKHSPPPLAWRHQKSLKASINWLGSTAWNDQVRRLSENRDPTRQLLHTLRYRLYSQNDFPSLRLLFSDNLLVTNCRLNIQWLLLKHFF